MEPQSWVKSTNPAVIKNSPTFNFLISFLASSAKLNDKNSICAEYSELICL